ncbi:glycosyltransferase family 1 protein [Nakamurella antarctica]|uniref:Glycosyltransferase family 1 protein n=1 Tax=Nakamurella antarctica TaxID=1902245 RepID=A0A3G8ZMG9_9ACTN|nr:glycosyltransferase family 1 protein [Nakamurella antarctica]AZI58519.1 glycosyltransferase family 1 protein [Nakamurella antarctica]
MPKTLAVVVEQCLSPVPGGTGRYAAQITQALAAGAPAGWEVRSLTAWHTNPDAARFSGVRGPSRLPVGHRVLGALWQKGMPPWPNPASLHATTPLAPRHRSPRVVTVHDTVPWTHPETMTPRGVRWHRDLITSAARAADALVVPTRAVAEELSVLFPYAASRIHAIAHGVTSLPIPRDADLRATKMRLPPRYVMSLSTLEPRKGLDVLLSAMAQMAVRVPLVVVGQPGWGGLNIQAQAAKAGLCAGSVVELGKIDDEDLAVVLSRAAVLAVPSLAEGFGLPVLEGFSAGLPVVSSDAPSLVEVSGGAALLSPRRDFHSLAHQLDSVLLDADLAAELVARGRARAAEYSWAKAARSVWDLHTGLA